MPKAFIVFSHEVSTSLEAFNKRLKMNMKLVKLVNETNYYNFDHFKKTSWNSNLAGIKATFLY